MSLLCVCSCSCTLFCFGSSLPSSAGSSSTNQTPCTAMLFSLRASPTWQLLCPVGMGWLLQHKAPSLLPAAARTSLASEPLTVHTFSSTSSEPGDAPATAAAAAAAQTALVPVREPETPLLHAIRNRILVRGGPLSVAEYMQEVLTNPVSGYYMKRDVFGSRGDFTTSPEISQMFGEMLGIWCVVVWQQLGCPSALQLVELGPGRGTLMADLLRGTAAFKPFVESLQVHLVEVSPYLRREQWKKLQCTTTTITTNSTSSTSSSDGSNASSSSSSRAQSDQLPESGLSEISGSQVTWHASLDAVPNAGPSIYIAHEFLDALPVHQFVRDPRRGWLEVMVDTVDDVEVANTTTTSSSSSSALGSSHSHSQTPSVSPEGIPLVQTQPIKLQQQQQKQQQGSGSSSSQGSASAPSDEGLHLRFVLSPSPTPAAQLLVNRRLEALGQPGSQQQQPQVQAVEIGAQAMAVVESLGRRIAATGGAALLVDYGANKPYTNSLTGIRNHQGVHPLSQPGTADLSAWVDFSAMRMAAEQAFDIQPAGAVSAAAAAGTGAAAATAGAGSSDGSSSSSSGVDVFGPVTQEQLLHSLGIQARLQALAESATPQQAEDLLSGYKRLTDTGPGGMGGSYLALALASQGLGTPVGFEQQQQQQE